MGKRRVLRSQNTILSAALVIAIASAVNAMLGLVKNRLLTKFFGVSSDLTVFLTADRIPNAIYSILVVGAVSTIFIPTFTSLLKRNEKRAFKVAGSIIYSVLFIFFILGAVSYIFSPQIIRLISVGKFTPEEITLGIRIMRIMLLSQLFLITGSILTSILQSYKYFIIPALAPVLYNTGMILGIIFLSDRYGILGPTYGIVIGSVLHLAIQVPYLKSTNFRFVKKLNLRDKSFIKALKLVPPRLAQTGLNSIIQTVSNSLAILVSKTSVIYMKYAMQLQFFPVSIFGLSMASALLPTLSGLSDKSSHEKFKESLTTSLHQMLFLVMPISAILFVLRIPVVRIVFGVSEFPWEATIITSYTLACYSISIFSQSTTYLLTRAFFALKDTKTPVIISLITGTLNILSSFIYVYFFNGQIWGIALIYSITSYVDVALLYLMLRKRVGRFGKNSTVVPFVKIAYSTFLMAITLYLGLKFLDIRFLDTTRTINLLILTAITTTVGIIVYLFFTKLLKVKEIELLYKLIGKLKIKKVLKSRKTPSVPQENID